MIKSAAEFVRLRLSDNREEYLRAAHEEADVRVWLDVIEQYPEMREWVAHNKKIPDEIIRVLSKDADRKVRFMIAMKNRTPADVLAELALDDDEGVRMNVACHKRAPKEVLELLVSDKCGDIQRKARARLNDEK